MSIQTGIQLQDQFSGVLYGIIDSVNLALGAMYDMQQAMGAEIDTSSLDAARENISQTTAALTELNRAIQQPAIQQPAIQQPAVPQAPEIPVTWNTDGLEVFTGNGIDRFQQEVQSANAMLERLSSTQDSIASQAMHMEFLPQGASQDISSLAVRIDNVRERIRQIEDNPLNLGTDMVNTELEQLRGQLSRMVQCQDDLNQAMQNMDVSAANEAYLRLTQTVGHTERYIRDNVDEQGRFNQQIRNGTVQADNLMRTITRVAAAYLSIRSAKNVLSISDELTQTTARLNMMNDAFQEMGAGFGSTDEMINAVYASAQDARGSFGGMAAIIARFGNNARDAFGSSAEAVDFANLIQKQMVLAGASTQESANAMLQLSQALGSGVLRGDELNSIFEQAPNLIQNIADYMDVPIGQIRQMASEGQLSADIVKSAIFAAADDINSKFEQMPMTWGQVWQSMQNTALMVFQPVLERINQLANSEGFQNFANGTMQAMGMLAETVLNVFDLIGTVGGFIADNWSTISPIVYGVAAALGFYIMVAGAVAIVNGIMAIATAVHAAAQAMQAGATFTATAAQYGLNAALMACPLTWIILLIIALIAIIFAVCSAIAKMTGVASSGFGVICGCINVVNMFFMNLAMTGWNVALAIGNAISALTNNMMTAFHNAICSIQSWFWNLLSTACSVIAGICAELNKLPFVEFDYSGVTAAADKYANKAAEAAGNKNDDYISVSDAFNKGMNTFDAFQDGWVKDAFDTGASWGDGIADKIGDFFNGNQNNNLDTRDGSQQMQVKPYGAGIGSSDIGNGIDGSNAAGNIADIKDSVSVTQEDLKYLRDLAEQETVNRFTIAKINIDQSGMKNTINGSNDLDGFVSGLTDAVNEAVETITEGVHN